MTIYVYSTFDRKNTLLTWKLLKKYHAIRWLIFPPFLKCFLFVCFASCLRLVVDINAPNMFLLPYQLDWDRGSTHIFFCEGIARWDAHENQSAYYRIFSYCQSNTIEAQKGCPRGKSLPFISFELHNLLSWAHWNLLYWLP